MHKFLWDTNFSFHLGKYLGVEYLGLSAAFYFLKKKNRIPMSDTIKYWFDKYEL